MNGTSSASSNRSLTATLERVELVVWALLFTVWLVFLVVSVVGAFVVSAQPVSPAVAAAVAAVLLGTVVFAAAEVLFE